MLKKIPSYIKYIFTNIFLLFIYLFVFRVIFFFLFAELEGASIAEIQKAFRLGIRFDIKLAVLSFFPLAILILITNYNFFKTLLYKRIANLYLVFIYLALTLFYVFDFGYYDYLNIRLDASSLRFLTNLKISLQVLIESYPVYKGLLGLLIICFLIYKLSRYVYKSFSNENRILSRKIKTVYFISTILILSYGVYNSITHYPLRWSEAFFSKKNGVNQFALNPVLYFFDSFSYRSEGVNMKKFDTYYPIIAKHLNLSQENLSFERKKVFDSISKKPNVVIVMMESVGVKPMSYYGNPIKSTPKMDSILQKSLRFSNFYVHKVGTAASVFSSITGLPDIENVRTASRNPLIQDQRVIFDQFDGYEKLYFLGGSANWANIRSVFQSNISGLKIFEEGSYETENRADVWGIDDFELFKESNKELAKLAKKDKPFIAYIQTASNHMPFTVPDKKESYKPLNENEVTEDLLKKSGFKSIAQLNALRYLDFNIDKFLKRAQTSGYYDNTIFAFFGDHNTAMTPTENYMKEYELGIQNHHVPFFIHAPKFVESATHTKNGKLIDLFPTLANLARVNHINYTLGNDLLDSLPSKNTSFVYLKIKGKPAVGLLKDSLYYCKSVIDDNDNTGKLYNLKTKETKDIKTIKPLLTKDMDSLLNAFYHSTKYLYFNNKKVK